MAAGASEIHPPGPQLHYDPRYYAAQVRDPERRARYGEAGRKRVDELFSWRAVAATVATAYEEVIADYRREQEESTSADR